MPVLIDTVNGDKRSKAPDAGPLYKKREPIYPKLVHGHFRMVKWVLLVVTLAVYYILPWLRWDRGPATPNQAVLVDFTHARFYFFFIQLWPQEVYYFTGLLVTAALALFLVSALFGRLWCGYTCPQTVWTDLYIVVERLFEGDRNARMRLDAAPTSFNKVWRKVGKHAVWLLVALVTGGAWVFYFDDAPTLMGQLFTGSAATSAYLPVAILTFTTYALAGSMREQVCTYMCPWPRIQGAMLDQHSLQVTYRADRGEARGPHKKGGSWEGRGDCIDCQQCVVVCPMGIDIRDGAQMECINCGLCIDACDEIMDRVERPRGLIAYDTDYAVAARLAKRKPTYHLIRPRTVFYALALALVGGIMIYGLLTRSPVAIDVLRDRNPEYVQLSDGAVRNGYTLQLMNRSTHPTVFWVEFKGPMGAMVRAVGQASPSTLAVPLEADGQRSLRVFVTVPQDRDEHDLHHNSPATFMITSQDGQRAEKKTVFLAAGDDR